MVDVLFTRVDKCLRSADNPAVYGKVFASLFTGSLYGKPPLVFAVWSYALANMRPHRPLNDECLVEINPTMLASLFASPVEAVLDVLDVLMAPDPASRSADEDGRRLVLVSGHRTVGPMQFRVVNGAKYRKIRNEDDRREYLADYQRRRRASMSTTVNTRKQSKPRSTQAEEEAEAEAELTLTLSNPPGGSDPKPADEIANLWAHHTQRRKQAIPGARELALTDDRRAAIRGLLRASYTADDVRAVIDHYADRAAADKAQGRWFNGTTEFIMKNFARTLGQVGSAGASGLLPADVIAWANEVRDDA